MVLPPLTHASAWRPAWQRLQTLTSSAPLSRFVRSSHRPFSPFVVFLVFLPGVPLQSFSLKIACRLTPPAARLLPSPCCMRAAPAPSSAWGRCVPLVGKKQALVGVGGRFNGPATDLRVVPNECRGVDYGFSIHPSFHSERKGLSLFSLSRRHGKSAPKKLFVMKHASDPTSDRTSRTALPTILDYLRMAFYGLPQICGADGGGRQRGWFSEVGGEPISYRLSW